MSRQGPALRVHRGADGSAGGRLPGPCRAFLGRRRRGRGQREPRVASMPCQGRGVVLGGGGRNKDVPFGKRLHSEVENHKSPSFGKSTICCAVFNSYVKLPEGEKTKLGLNHEISIKNRDS